MNWQWALVIGLLFFSGGLVLGFYLATKWMDPGDEIEIGKAKAKRGGILDLTNIFKRKNKKS